MKINPRQRLQTVSRRMAAVSQALVYGVPPLMIWGVFSALNNGSGSDLFNAVSVDPAAIGKIATAGIYVLYGMLALILSTALWHLHKTFRAMAGQQPQLEIAATCISVAGKWFLVAAVSGIFVRSCAIILATIHLPAGERLLTIGFGSSEFFGILVAGTLIALGHVIGLAASLDKENREFI